MTNTTTIPVTTFKSQTFDGWPIEVTAYGDRATFSAPGYLKFTVSLNLTARDAFELLAAAESMTYNELRDSYPAAAWS